LTQAKCPKEESAKCPKIQAEWTTSSPVGAGLRTGRVGDAGQIDGGEPSVAPDGQGNRQYHLGSPKAIKEICRYLRTRKSGWLHRAAKSMAQALREDWKVWRDERWGKMKRAI